MAKDINKILKTIEHFGEGTFDEIEQIVQSEQSVISSIDKEVLTDITGEESTLDIDIDSLLGEDLKSLGVATVEKEEGKEEKIEEKEPAIEEETELNFEDLKEKPEISGGKFKEETLTSELPEIESFSFEGLEEQVKPVEEELKEEPLEIKEGIETEKETASLELPDIESFSFEGLEQQIEPIKEEKKIEKKEKRTESEKTFEEAPSEEPSFEEIDLAGLEELSAQAIPEEEYGLEEKRERKEVGKEGRKEEEKAEELELEQPLEELSLEPTSETPSITPEEEQIPEEFVDLSLVASGLPLEHEIEHEKPHADYSNIELSDEDIHIIINTLKNYPAWLANEVKNLILNDALSPTELEGLLDLLSNNVHWKAVMEYLKNSLNIDLSYHLTPEEKVYIPTLTEKLLPYIKWISAITVLTIVIFVILLQFVIIPNQAQHYYKVAINVLEKENNVEEAMLNFKRASGMRRFEKYYLLFGRLLLEHNYLKESKIIAEQAIRFWPYNLAFYELLSDYYFIQGGTKNISESFRILEDLLADKKFASNPAVYEAIAKRYENIGEYQQAINIYSEGLRHFEPSFSYMVKMLNNFIILKNYDAASNMYSKLEKKYKKLVDPAVFTKYSQFLLDLNKPFEAKDVFDKVIKFKPTFAPAYLPYAQYYIQMNQPDVALSGLLKAEKYINLGLYKDKEKEETVFDKILNKIGELYYDRNDDTLAYTYFEKAISANPNFAPAYYNIGRLNYFFYNRYDVALNNFLKAESLGFSNNYQKYMIGWIQYHLKNYESALFSFLKLELDYLSNIDLKLAIGNSHIKFGKPELAIGYLSNYVAYWENMERLYRNRDIKNPKRQEALLKLAVGYNNLGVAYALLAKEKKNSAYESEALRLFIRSQEVYNFIYPGRVSNAESYINSLYILHPEVKRELLLMDNENYFPKMIF